MDWAKIRKYRLSTERPDQWPEGVFGISSQRVSLLGVHETSNKLYWDGKEIVTRIVVRLGTKELWLAAIASFSTLGMFVLALGSTFGWF
ncbi:MAG: hypothetical protein AAFM92_08425 [Pseudomonadota bacterium]